MDLGFEFGLSLPDSAFLPDPLTAPQYGHTDPYQIAGPLGHEVSFPTPDGYELMPSGPGVIRFVDTDIAVSGDGTTWETAFKTPQEAFDVHGEGDLILAHTERSEAEELVLLPDFGLNKGTVANPVRFAKSGTGIFRIRATKRPALEGAWQVCANAAEALGNPLFANIYVANVTIGVDFNGDPLELHDAMLLEGDLQGSMSMLGQEYGTGDTTEKMRIPPDKRYWWDGNAAGSDIADLTKSAETGAITTGSAKFGTYVQGTLDGCRVLLNGSANTYIDVPLTSHNAVTGELSFTNDVPPNATWSTKQIALRNLPAYISAAGQWAARDNLDGTWKVWYWPHDPVNLPRVGVSARHACIDLRDASNFIMFGIQCAGAGGKFPQDGRNGSGIFSSRHNLNDRSNVVIEECHSFANSICGINTQRINGVRLLNSTGKSTLIGRGGDCTKVTGGVIKGCDFATTGLTAFSFYGMQQCLILRTRLADVRSVHGNGGSIYLGAKDVWLNGCLIDTEQAIGLTTQDSGNVYITNTTIILGPDIALRGYDDNSDFPSGYDRTGGYYTTVKTTYATPGRHSLIGNTFLFGEGVPYDTLTAAAVYCKTTWSRNTFACNVVAGAVTRAEASITDPLEPFTYDATMLADESYNVIMGSHASLPDLPILDLATNVLVTDPTEVVANPVNDPTPVPLGRADGHGGDQTAGLPIGEAWVTALPFSELLDTDFAGQPIDRTKHPIGSVKGPSVDNPVQPSNMTVAPDPMSLDEKVAIGTVAGVLDAAGSQPIAYSEILDPDNKFAISGNSIVTTAALDYDVATSHALTVRASNDGGNVDRLFTITVIENNIREPDEILAVGELLLWIDGRTGVAHTGGALEEWADRVGGPSLLKIASGVAPTYFANGYVRFLDDISDQIAGTPPVDLSGFALSDVWIRGRSHGPENFILASDRGTGTPFIGIGESGAGGSMHATLGSPTTYIDGTARVTRADAYTRMAGPAFHTMQIEAADVTAATDFALSGYLPAAFNGPVDIAQVAITANALAGDAAQKRADLRTFFDSLSYT